MNVSLEKVLHDLTSQPGLGMFIWMCLVFFVVAFIFFLWAVKSGQFSGLEESKFDMLEDNPKKEVKNNG